MSFTLQVLIAAAGTYLLRVSMIAFTAGRQIPPRTEAVLRLIPAAVLSALVANALVFDDGAPRAFGPWYPAFAAAVIVAAVTRSVGWTLVTGMAAVWALTALWP
ncbi:MAG: AzlD domain-containing protein [Microthrixaceae bacterium]